MKTIVESSSNLSKYLLSDDVAVSINANSITVGNPIQFTVADLNAENSVMHEGVTAPADWVGNKYFYRSGSWTLNPDWVAPKME